jgi:hypothetical protein
MYENAVVHLLACEEVEGISPATLRIFQESYASTAFRCRFPNCDRLSIGFATAELRLEHETVHLQRVYCQTPSCWYNRIGFANRSALAAHTRKHHGQSNMPSIPAKIRRTSDAKERTGAKPSLSQDSQALSPELTYPPHLDLQPVSQEQRVIAARRVAAARQLLQQSPDMINATDSSAFPPTVLHPQIRANVPLDIKSWGQLKQWAVWNPVLTPGLNMDKLILLQALCYEDDRGNIVD